MNFKISLVLLCVTQYAMAAVEYDVVDDTEDVRDNVRDPDLTEAPEKERLGDKIGKIKFVRKQMIGEEQLRGNTFNINAGKAPYENILTNKNSNKGRGTITEMEAPERKQRRSRGKLGKTVVRKPIVGEDERDFAYINNAGEGSNDNIDTNVNVLDSNANVTDGLGGTEDVRTDMWVTEAEMEAPERKQRRSGGKLGKTVVRKPIVGEDETDFAYINNAGEGSNDNIDTIVDVLDFNANATDGLGGTEDVRTDMWGTKPEMEAPEKKQRRSGGKLGKTVVRKPIVGEDERDNAYINNAGEGTYDNIETNANVLDSNANATDGRGGTENVRTDMWVTELEMEAPERNQRLSGGKLGKTVVRKPIVGEDARDSAYINNAGEGTNDNINFNNVVDFNANATDDLVATEDVRTDEPAVVHERKQRRSGGKQGTKLVDKPTGGGQRRGNVQIHNEGAADYNRVAIDIGSSNIYNKAPVNLVHTNINKTVIVDVADSSASIEVMGKQNRQRKSAVAKVKLWGNDNELPTVPHIGARPRPIGMQGRLIQRNKVKTIQIGDFDVTFELIEDNFGKRNYRMAGNEEESDQRSDDPTDINNDQPLNEAMALVDMENK